MFNVAVRYGLPWHLSKSGEAVINHGDARERMPRKKETQLRQKKAWKRRRAATRPTSLGRVNQRLCNRSWCQREDGEQFCGDFQLALGQGCAPEWDGKPRRAGWRSNMIWVIADILANILFKKKRSEQWKLMWIHLTKFPLRWVSYRVLSEQWHISEIGVNVLVL